MSNMKTFKEILQIELSEDAYKDRQLKRLGKAKAQLKAGRVNKKSKAQQKQIARTKIIKHGEGGKAELVTRDHAVSVGSKNKESRNKSRAMKKGGVQAKIARTKKRTQHKSLAIKKKIAVLKEK